MSEPLLDVCYGCPPGARRRVLDSDVLLERSALEFPDPRGISGRGALDPQFLSAHPEVVGRHQGSPGRNSQLIGDARSICAVACVSSTMMYPSSSAVRCSPSFVRTNVGPRQVLQPSRS